MIPFIAMWSGDRIVLSTGGAVGIGIGGAALSPDGIGATGGLPIAAGVIA
jgi:hypothetical protein